MNKEQLISKISDENAIPEADVEEVYDEKLEECKDAGMSGEEAEERALKRVWNAFKRRSMSNADKVQGIFLGCGDRYDAVGYNRTQAIEAYQENPQQAIKSGKIALAIPPEDEEDIVGNGVQSVGEKNGWSIIAKSEKTLQYDFAERGTEQEDDADTEIEDEEWRVYPLDTQRKYRSGDKNDDYLTPLPKHSWRRAAVGVFRVDEDGDAQISRITFSGKQSISPPPLFEPVEFKARTNEADDDKLGMYINSTSETTITEYPELEDDWPDVIGIIDKMFRDTEWFHDLPSLYAYLDEDGTRENVIVKADVVDLDMEPNSNGTLRMVLGDFQFEGGEMVEQEATVWIPEEHDKYIDFATESEVFVVGQARLVDGYDSVKGERTPDVKEVSINGQGVIADPNVKIPREDSVQELDEEDMDFDDEGEW